MKTAWLKGLSADSKKEMTASFKGSLVLRKRLQVLLDAKEKEFERSSISKDGYDSPNWAYKQADLVGYKRALSEINSLLDA